MSKYSPNHYQRGYIEVWDFIEDQDLDYFLGNVIKYVCRAGYKPEEHMLEDLNALVRADVTTKNKQKKQEIHQTLDEMEKRIEEVKAKEELSKIRPALSGDEIMEHFNIQPGPKVGVIMKALYEQRINDGEVSKEDALKLAEETYKNL